MLKKKNCCSKDDWLRSRGIGATDVATILGIGKWRTTLDIYLKMVGGVEKEVEDNEAMKRGRDLEPYIRKTFGIDHQEYVVTNPPKNNWVWFDTDRPYLTGSLDGVLRERKGLKRKGILEIKTVDVKDRESDRSWSDGVLPNQYYCQGLTYIGITGYDYIWFRAYIRYLKYDVKNREYKVDRYEMKDYYIEAEEKKDEINYVLNAVDNFKKEYVDKKIFPPVRIQ